MWLDHLAINEQTFVTFHSAVAELSDFKLQQNLHANMEGFRRDSHIYKQLATICIITIIGFI